MDKATVDYYTENAQIVAARYESVVSNLAASFERAFKPRSKVLDIGCGSGRDLAVLASLGHDCYGVDATPELVEIAQDLHAELRGRVLQDTLPDLKFPFGESFDAVLCSAVLMHLPVDELAPSVRAIRRCLREQGRLLYSIPSKRLDVVLQDRDSSGRLFIPDQTDRLQRLFEQAGFRLVSKWNDSDSLGRDAVTWLSVLMELEAA